jgi:hypothetical protein
LHSSPSLYNFIISQVQGTWNVPTGDINLVAHSLGNLVAWDALRIAQWRTAGTPIVNNFIGFEAAVWQEMLFPENSIEYAAASSPPQEYEKYEVPALRRHSWAFWARQSGHQALTSIAGGFCHSYVPRDSALAWMRWGDWQAHPHHYYRTGFSSDRDMDSLNSIPALINDGMRHWNPDLPHVDEEDLHLPLGCVGSLHPPGAPSTNVPAMDRQNPFANGWGWGETAHGDFREQPLFTIYPWYKHFIASGIGVVP